MLRLTGRYIILSVCVFCLFTCVLIVSSLSYTFLAVLCHFPGTGITSDAANSQVQRVVVNSLAREPAVVAVIKISL